MNGFAAKSERRGIRRAFGPTAIETLRDQDEAIRYLVQLTKPLTRGFWGRLQWLILGR